MLIKLIEPLNVDNDYIKNLGASLESIGHKFVAYDTMFSSEDEQLDRAKDADILIIANTPLKNEIIEQCSKLKYISVAFTGIDHVGKEACIARDIKVSNAQGYCTDSVVELTYGLIFDLLRNIRDCDTAIRKGLSKNGLVGNELKGKTMGIVGTGAIGAEVARIAKAFGCNVVGYDLQENYKLNEIGMEYLSLEELLQKSDIVTLHMPLTNKTKGLIGSKELALMKESSLLINCARGPIVDTNALVDALENKKIRGAGLDVFDMEPPLDKEYQILKVENCILTPHVAFATKESMINRAKITFGNIESWLTGGSQNIINL